MSFDKLAFARRLEGPETFSRPQAEALTEAFDAAIKDTVATKQDLSVLEAGLRGEMADLRTEPRGEMADLRTELRGGMADLRADFAQLRAEFAQLRADFAQLRAEVRIEVAGLRTAIAETRLWFVAVLASVITSGIGVVLTLLKH
jgi:predicted  nucleic acid-binding Zn-ribbon protein